MKLIISISLLVLISLCAYGITTPKPGHYDFTIDTTQGKISTQDLRGNFLIVFFGFTKCPHVCPAVFKTMNQLSEKAPKKLQDKIKIIFISVDHYRDSIENMKSNPMIGKKILAATSDPAHLHKISSLFKADFSVKLNVDKEPIVSHSGLVFMIDPTGKRLESLNYDASAEEFLTKLETLDNPPPNEINWDNRFPTLLGENKDCDLAKGPCTIKTAEGKFDLRFSTLPLTENSNEQLEFKMSDSTLVPIEIDITGIDLNMGIIRPKFLKTSPTNHKASLKLPLCEVPTMLWKANVLLRNQADKTFNLTYYFKLK